jgi:hypothetical protein
MTRYIILKNCTIIVYTVGYIEIFLLIFFEDLKFDFFGV